MVSEGEMSFQRMSKAQSSFSQVLPVYFYMLSSQTVWKIQRILYYDLYFLKPESCVVDENLRLSLPANKTNVVKAKLKKRFQLERIQS